MNEMFGYSWTLIATRPATADEAQYFAGCQVSVADDGCPCCNCGEIVAVIQTYARPRYSKSSKRIVEEQDVAYVCPAHVE